MSAKSIAEPSRQLISRKLLTRLRLFWVVFLLMLGIAVYDVVQGSIGLATASIGLLIGLLAGVVAGRIFKIGWDAETTQVVAQVDALGAVILVLYLAFSLFRKQLFSYWLQGPALMAFGFCVVAGVMLGRILATQLSIRCILLMQETG